MVRRSEPRKLVRWDNETDMLCFLAIPRVMAKRGIKFPWGEVAAYIGEHVSGNALLQHMSKETKKRCREGRPIPEDREQFIKAPGHYELISAAGFGDRRTRTLSDIQARRDSRVEDDDDDDFDGKQEEPLATPSRSSSKRKTKPVIKNESGESDDDDFMPEESPSKKRRVALPVNQDNHERNAQLVLQPKISDSVKEESVTTNTIECLETVQDMGTQMQANDILNCLLFGNGNDFGDQKACLRNDRFLTITFRERAAQINFQRMALQQEREMVKTAESQEQDTIAHQQVDTTAGPTVFSQFNSTPDYVMNAIYPSSSQGSMMSSNTSFMPFNQDQLASSFDTNAVGGDFSLPFNMMTMPNGFHSGFVNSDQYDSNVFGTPAQSDSTPFTTPDRHQNTPYNTPVQPVSADARNRQLQAAVVANILGPDAQLEDSQDDEEEQEQEPQSSFFEDSFWPMDAEEEDSSSGHV